MADLVNIKQVGQERILKELNNLSDELKVKAVRAGLTSVAKPITASMKGGIHSVTGALKKSIGKTALNARQKGRLNIAGDAEAVIIGPNRKVNGRSQSRKAGLVERGAKAHRITAKDGGVLAAAGILFGSSIKHPGARAKPFIKPALDRNKSGIKGRFYDGLQRWLTKNA